MFRLFARKRRVRLHFADMDPSIQGLLVGRYGGHYILENPSVLEASDRTIKMSGHVEVPAEKVWFVQVNP